MGASHYVAAAVIAAGAYASPVVAQAGTDFTYIELSAGGAAQTLQPYDGQWSSGPGAVVGAATPLLGGHVALAFRAYPNDAIGEDLPDFLAVHGMAGWGPLVPLPAGIRFVPAAHVGVVAFRFDDDGAFTGALRNETEVIAGIAARVSIPITGQVSAWAAVDGARVFTTPSDDLLFLEAGVGISLRSPSWLRRALR